MKITIKLNGVKVEREIPISWDEVTFGQFLDLSQAGNDRAKILSVFTGIEAETLRKAQIVNFEVINNIISFVERDEINMTLPKEILGFKMPDNLQLETIGQFEDLKLESSKIKDQSKESLSVYTKFCAIYATNHYDYSEAEKLAPQFLNAPCGEVLAIGNFTLMKLIESKDSTLTKALRPPSHLRRLKLAMIGWLKRLVFTARYYSWKRKLHLTERSY